MGVLLASIPASVRGDLIACSWERSAFLRILLVQRMEGEAARFIQASVHLSLQGKLGFVLTPALLMHPAPRTKSAARMDVVVYAHRPVLSWVITQVSARWSLREQLVAVS